MANITGIVQGVQHLTQSANGLRKLFYASSFAAAAGVVVSGIEKKSEKRIWSGLEFGAANILSIGLLSLPQVSPRLKLLGALGVAVLDGIKFNAGTKSMGASYDELKNPNWLTKTIHDKSPEKWLGTDSDFPTRPFEWFKAFAIMLRDGLLVTSAFIPLHKYLNQTCKLASGKLYILSLIDGACNMDIGMLSSGVSQFYATKYLGMRNKILEAEGNAAKKDAVPHLLKSSIPNRYFKFAKFGVYAAVAVAAWFTMIRPTIENIAAPADKSKRPPRGDIQVATVEQKSDFWNTLRTSQASLLGSLPPAPSEAAPQDSIAAQPPAITAPTAPIAEAQAEPVEIAPAVVAAPEEPRQAPVKKPVLKVENTAPAPVRIPEPAIAYEATANESGLPLNQNMFSENKVIAERAYADKRERDAVLDRIAQLNRLANAKALPYTIQLPEAAEVHEPQIADAAPNSTLLFGNDEALSPANTANEPTSSEVVPMLPTVSIDSYFKPMNYRPLDQ